MLIDFKKVILKNFLSYADAEINLEDQGYCLIRGENKFKPDLALSNGSGKSSIINAICWALTGETTNGNSSNIKNIHIEDKECWVKLEFICDKHNYEITRYNQPKSDLKIIVDGEDKSGKGIRESENQLATILPDLSADLITNVILLGQGLPNKLSSHSPSGRKELLEKLSKSDFMIQDIKTRITTRENYLNEQLRLTEDSQLKNKTELNLYESLLVKTIESLNELLNVNYDEDILRYRLELGRQQVALDPLEKELIKYQEEKNSVSQKLASINSEVVSKKSEINLKYSKRISELKESRAVLNTEEKSLSQEITRLKNIVDICPTCGQKIPNAVKPDTTDKESHLISIQSEIKKLNESLNQISSDNELELQKIEQLFSENILKLQEQLQLLNSKISELTKSSSDIKNTIRNSENNLNQLVVKKESLANNIKNLTEQKEKYEEAIKRNRDLIEALDKKHAELEDHLAVIRKMNTFVKRDFRGYLLADVINFIDFKAKEYAKDMFDSSNISVQLNGNDIDICFNEKLCESLSGGERQKVDLIIQLAIRDMLTTYLDFHSSILCLDEIADNLDTIGSAKMFDLIANKLPDVDSIFIISHHEDELMIPIDMELKVRKDENGISHIEV